MSKDIYIDTGDLSSRLLKKTSSALENASEKLATINSCPMYQSPTGYEPLFPSDVISDIINLKNAIDNLQNKTDVYAKLIENGPDALCDIDAKCKNDITSWWDRATYEDGWLRKFFCNDLKTSDAVFIREGEVNRDFLGIGAGAGYAVNCLFYEAKIKNSAEWDLDKGNIGISTKASAKGGLAKLSGDVSYGLASTSGEIEVGTIEGSVKSTFSFMKDGELDPQFEVGVKAAAEGISAEIEQQFGTDDFNLHKKAEGVVGVAEAEAKAAISKDGITAKAEVGAAALQGEVTGGITVFGINIDVSAKGEVAAIGAGAEFNASEDSFELGGKLAFLAGLGLKVKVSW